MTFDFGAGGEPRVFELVNKTNQFNLNGRRYTEADWHKLLAAPGAVLAAVSYEDKYRTAGDDCGAGGRVDGDCLHVETWVMSCRAFARRIEHQALKMLFDGTGRHGDAIRLHAHGKKRAYARFLYRPAGRGAAVGVPLDAFAVRGRSVPPYIMRCAR